MTTYKPAAAHIDTYYQRHAAYIEATNRRHLACARLRLALAVSVAVNLITLATLVACI